MKNLRPLAALLLLFCFTVPVLAQSFDYAPPPFGSTAKVMRDDLALELTGIDGDKQDADADLSTWAGITPTANAQSLLVAANYAAMRALLDLEAGTDFYSIAAADAAFQPLDADLTLIAAGAFTDPNLDQFVWWDDSQGRFEFATIADLATEAVPAAGDYLVLYGAEGDARKVDWSSLPGVGGGINNVSEDASPTLGGDLEGNSFKLGTVASQAEGVFLEEAACINWDNGDLTLCQAGNVASIAGGLLSGASVEAATSSAAGVAEFATDAETITGTDTSRAITPANLIARLNDGTQIFTQVNKGTLEQITTDTTLSDDAILKFPVVASGRYTFRFFVSVVTTGATPDFKYALVGPTADIAISKIEVYRVGTAPTVPVFSMSSVTSATTYIASTAVVMGAENVLMTIEGHATINSGGGGTIAFQWAQNTSDAAVTGVREGSYVEFVKVN